jgi:hypothetical protein
MATAPLSEKFGVARHKVTTDVEEGDQDKSMHVQQVIVSVVHRVKEGHERSKAMDWMSVCTMPHLIAVNKSQEPSTWWDSSEICIWTDPELLTVEEVRVWQYCINKRFSDEDRIASLWLKDFVYASSTDALKTAVMKKYDKLPDNQRGGAVYLYLTLMEMFQMSREVKDAMLTFIGLFKRKGIARYPGENVLLASEEIMGVCKRLDAGKGLLDEHVIDILTGLAISSNPRFRKMFDHLKQCADLGNLDFLDTIVASDPPLVKIEAIMEKAVDVYDKLCVAGHWIKLDKSSQRALVNAVNICWNCGAQGHAAGNCPKPRDNATFEKNKKAFYDNRRSKEGQAGGDRRGKKGGDKNKDKSSAEYQRKVWANQGIAMVNGSLMVNCKSCGFNTTHSTKFHDLWAENPTTFRLSANHSYTKALASLGSGSHGNVKPPPPPPPPPNTGTTSGTAGNMLSIDRAVLEQRISDFERESTNPSASDVSEAIRALLLK